MKYKKGQAGKTRKKSIEEQELEDRLRELREQRGYVPNIGDTVRISRDYPLPSLAGTMVKVIGKLKIPPAVIFQMPTRKSIIFLRWIERVA